MSSPKANFSCRSSLITCLGVCSDYSGTMQVPGNLVISARSGAHSFDASTMNMSHIVSHLSFGKKISPAVMRNMKRVLPYLGVSHDKLNGQAYIIHPGDSNADVTVSSLSLSLGTNYSYISQDRFFPLYAFGG